MLIISWNVNGIRAVERKGLFAPLVEKYRPDILCLQETKAKEGESTVDTEYEKYWNPATKKGYAGTAIFSKAKPLSVFLNLPEAIARKYKVADDDYGNPNAEGRVITLEYEKFFAVSVYTPNAKDDLSRLSLRQEKWDPAFLEYMLELEKRKPVIFAGDLNVAHTEKDLARPKENVGNKGFTAEEREGIQKIIDAGFADTFRLFNKEEGNYTWWSHFANARARNIGWRIDYIFVSQKLAEKVKRAEVLPEVMGSDHCPTLVEIVI